MGMRAVRSSLRFGVAFLLMGAFCLGCETKTSGDGSVVFDVNKTAIHAFYDKASVVVGEVKNIVVPTDARVGRGGVPGRIDIFMEKSFYGGIRPLDTVPIRRYRKLMGCVKKTDGDKVIIATYDNWDSTHESEVSRVCLVIRVPVDVQVETRKRLSGRYDTRLGYGGRSPQDDGIIPGQNGWEAIPDEPDPHLTARSATKF